VAKGREPVREAEPSGVEQRREHALLAPAPGPQRCELRLAVGQRALERCAPLPKILELGARTLELRVPDVRADEVMDSIGLETFEHGIAIPRLDRLGNSLRPRGISGPDDREAEERRHRGEAQVGARFHEVLERGQDPVAGATLTLRRCVQQQSLLRQSRVAGNEQGPPVERLTVLLGNPLRVPVRVPSAVRPAHVVEHQQRQLTSPGALADDAKLAADREVVVVAVDDHRVRER
jgi:hypothetical protein